MNEKTLSDADLDELEEMAATVESGKMTSALYGTLLPGVFPALVAMARQAPRWVPVEEGMPKGGEVLFLWDGHVAVGLFAPRDGVWWAGGGAHRTRGPADPRGVVTHWMPISALPEPPR